MVTHRKAKLIVTDKEDGVLVFCQAGCEFIDIVRALKEQELWPEPTLEQKEFIRKRVLEKDLIKARIWIAVFESFERKKTKEDWKKYWEYKRLLK